MVVWTIFVQPDDFPEHIVMRRFFVGPGVVNPAPIACLYSSLKEARDDVPEGLYNMRRAPTDEPAIYESWI